MSYEKFQEIPVERLFMDAANEWQQYNKNPCKRLGNGNSSDISNFRSSPFWFEFDLVSLNRNNVSYADQLYIIFAKLCVEMLRICLWIILRVKKTVTFLASRKHNRKEDSSCKAWWFHKFKLQSAFYKLKSNLLIKLAAFQR